MMLIRVFIMLTVLAVCGHSLFAASEVEHVLELISESQLPRERVYLHLDNTSYHYGDNIWFNAYLVNADGNSMPPLSNTLYVELLTPGGLVLQTKALKVTDGQANSEFAIDFLPFYSGFYEIRAYTKYMLNYGDVAIFHVLYPFLTNLPTRQTASGGVCRNTGRAYTSMCVKNLIRVSR